MKKEIEQKYDNEAKDHYIIVDTKILFFQRIYNELDKIEMINNCMKYEITIDEIIIRVQINFKEFFTITIDDSKPICIYKPKILKIGVHRRKCYNEKQVIQFLNCYEIDIKKLMINKEKIMISKLFTMDTNEIELNIESDSIEKECKFEIYSRKENNSDILLSELVRNKKYINFTPQSKYFATKKRNNFLSLINKEIYSDSDLIIYGPSGIGKTVSLLAYRYIQQNKNVLYLNLKSLFSLIDKTKIFKEIIDELGYCFSDNILFNNFINKHLIKIINKKYKYTDYEFICKCIKKIIKNQKEIIRDNEIFLIIIDQYKYLYDKDKIIINSLNKYKENINYKYLVCSSMNEENIRELLYQDLFIENHNVSLLYVEPFDIDVSFLDKIKQNYAKEFGYFPKYIEEIQKEDNMEAYLSDKLNYLSNKITLFILSRISNLDIKLFKICKEIIKLENVEIDKNQMQRLFTYLPLKYIVPSKKEENKYIFKYSFPFIKKVLNNIIENSINEINMDLFENNRKIDNVGWNFEKLVKYYFRTETAPFPDLNKRIKQKIQIDSIMDFKTLNIDIVLTDEHINLIEREYNIKDIVDKKNICKNLIKDGIILIDQKSNGESYDFALLIPLNNKNEYAMLILQAT